MSNLFQTLSQFFLRKESRMKSQEFEDVVDALLRISPSASVCDVRSACKEKRVLCAMLPAGMRFRMTGVNVLEVRYVPGGGREELAKRELLRQAGMGVTGCERGHSNKKRYEANRYFTKINRAILNHG